MSLNRFFQIFLSPKITKTNLCALFGLGGLSILALPPFHIVPILWVILPLFGAKVLSAENVKTATIKSFVFFFSYFTFGLYWISYALWVDIAQFWWVLPFALFGLPLSLSIFMTLPLALLKYVSPRTPLLWWLGLTIAWFLGDLMRSNLFTGFPWNMVVSTWMADATLNIAQNLAWLGVNGLNGITVFLALTPLFVFLTDNKISRLMASTFMIVLLALMIGYGYVVEKIFVVEPSDQTYRLVQPNISQKEKWQPEFRRRNIIELINLSTEEKSTEPEAIIWPETAMAVMTTEDQYIIESLVRNNILKDDQTLIAGVLEADNAGLHNAVVVYNEKGQVDARYTKHHLVPFGEYLPFQEYWPVDPVAFMGEGFRFGSGPDTLVLKNGDRLGALICYEVIFSHTVPSEEKMDAIINVTNDAWYGNTTGPRQHLSYARMRAIEQRKTVLRVANTGISAVYDPLGRERERLSLNTKGVIDTPIYKIVN